MIVNCAFALPLTRCFFPTPCPLPGEGESFIAGLRPALRLAALLTRKRWRRVWCCAVVAFQTDKLQSRRRRAGAGAQPLRLYSPPSLLAGKGETEEEEGQRASSNVKRNGKTAIRFIAKANLTVNGKACAIIVNCALSIVNYKNHSLAACSILTIQRSLRIFAAYPATFAPMVARWLSGSPVPADPHGLIML